MWYFILEENLVSTISVVVSFVVVIGIALYRSWGTENIPTPTCPTCPRPEFTAKDPDVIIIGGGFTGATLAAVLASDGRKVVVLERNMSPPDTIRGEGMMPGGVVALQKLNLEHVFEKVPHTRLDGYVFFDKTQDSPICLPMLTVSGYLSRHGDLVTALRKNAMDKENVTFINAVGKDLVNEQGRVVGVEYKEKGSDDLKTIRAPLTVMCDGYYSSLRKKFTSLPKPVPTTTIVWHELTDVDAPKGPGHTQVFMGNPLGVYFIYSVGGNKYRFAFELEGEPPKDLAKFIRDLAPSMPAYVRKSVLEALDEGPPKYVPVRVAQGDLTTIPPGVLLIGDVLNSRDPISANGMSVSLHDIGYWRDSLQGVDLCDDQAMFKLRLGFRKARHSWAWANNTLGHVMYSLLVQADVGSCRMREQFVRDLKQTEAAPKEAIRGLMDILYGVNTDPATHKGMLENVRKASIHHAFQSRPWTGVLSAIYEAIAIHFRFKDMMGPAFKAYAANEYH